MAKEKESEIAQEVKEVEKEIVKEEAKAMKELKKNPWIAGTFVFAVVALILLFIAFRGGVGGGVSQSAIGAQAVSFINNDLLQGQGNVTLDSVSVEGGLYKVLVDYNGQQVPTYFTKDGKFYLGNQMYPTAPTPANASSTTPTTPAKDVPKSDKPIVELFVMSYCPYGTQAEKGIIPAVKALGSKIDFKVRFVHYTMHGAKEDEENARQLCIRNDQSALYLNYLSCFLEDGNATRCVAKTGVNNAALATCMNGKAKDYYAADSALSQGYGVQGSPTLIINGVEANFYPRDPATALSTICAAFTTAPNECNSVLSTANPDPGFGTTSTPAVTGTATATDTATANAAAAAGCASA